MTLVEFLLARITEDEALVSGAVDDYFGDKWATFAWGNEIDINKTRILAECEAKRRIITLHKSGDAWCDHCSGWYGPDPAADCPTLRLLTLPYAGHPDYLNEWRP